MPFVTVISHQLWFSLSYIDTCANLHSFPYSDNGFVILPSSMMTYNMTFTSQLAFSASDLEKQLLIRLDIHKPDTISHVNCAGLLHAKYTRIYGGYGSHAIHYFPHDVTCTITITIYLTHMHLFRTVFDTYSGYYCIPLPNYRHHYMYHILCTAVHTEMISKLQIESLELFHYVNKPVNEAYRCNACMRMFTPLSIFVLLPKISTIS